MKKFISLIILVSVTTTTSIFQSCKKENAVPVTEELPVLLLEKLNYYPYEIAQLNVTNGDAGTGNIIAKLNGQIIDVGASGSTLVFIVPDIGAGIYPFEVTIGDHITTTEIEVQNHQIALDPNQVVLSAIQYNDSITQLLTQYADSLPLVKKDSLLDDIQNFNSWFSNLQIQYAALNTVEKLEFAKLLTANKWWLDEIQGSTDFLTAELSNLRMATVVEDYDLKVETAMNAFVSAKVKVLKHIPKIVRFTVGGGVLGGLLGSLAGPGGTVGGVNVGASVGAGIAIAKFIADYLKLDYAIDNLLNTTLIPYQNLNGYRILNTTLLFNNQVEKNITITMDYRNVNIQDKFSSLPIIRTFYNGLNELIAGWNKIKTYLPNYVQAPSNFDDITIVNTKTVIIHSRYISLSNISNSSISLINTDKTDGDLKLTFKNNSNLDQNFTFDLNYNNSVLGNLDTVINAFITADTLANGGCTIGWSGQTVIDPVQFCNLGIIAACNCLPGDQFIGIGVYQINNLGQNVKVGDIKWNSTGIYLRCSSDSTGGIVECNGCGCDGMVYPF